MRSDPQVARLRNPHRTRTVPPAAAGADWTVRSRSVPAASLCVHQMGDDPKTLLGTYADLLPRSDAQDAEAVAEVLDDKALTESAV
jgi:hypothetical protein